MRKGILGAAPGLALLLLAGGCGPGNTDGDLAGRAALAQPPAQAAPLPRVDDCRALHRAVGRGDVRDPFPGREW